MWVVNPADSSVAMRTIEVPRNYTPAGQPELAGDGNSLDELPHCG